MKTNLKTIISGIVTGFFNGLFGSGGGTIIVPAMEYLMDVETHKAHATAIAVILPLSIVSLVVYIQSVELLLYEAAVVSAGGVAGSFLGSRLLKKISGKWLNIIFGLFMLQTAARMIL